VCCIDPEIETSIVLPTTSLALVGRVECVAVSREVIGVVERAETEKVRLKNGIGQHNVRCDFFRDVASVCRLDTPSIFLRTRSG
jgi:hypothetical protein